MKRDDLTLILRDLAEALTPRWLFWAVVKHGRTVRFVSAPNAPTAEMMLRTGERLSGPGRQRVPSGFDVETYGEPSLPSEERGGKEEPNDPDHHQR